MKGRTKLFLLAALNAFFGAWIVWNMLDWPADSITSAAAYGLGLYLVAPLFILSTAISLVSAFRAPNQPAAIGCALVLPILFGLVIAAGLIFD